MSKKQKILILVGPTSSGKSALAVSLARKFGGEVISADSRQMYRGLNIGTGKITKREMKGVPHHLLDVVSPKQTFTAYDFVQTARRKIKIMIYHNKLPIIAGGTGFYIDALVGRIILPDVPANMKLRAKLGKKSATQLFAMLKKKDPRRAKTIDSHNKVRIIRALEVVHALGKVPRPSKNNSLYDTLWMGIAVPKKELDKKINVRLFVRIRQGMVREARRLHAQGLSYKRMESFGLEYRALARFLQGKIRRAQMLKQLNFDIRHYAKRQMTYWRRNKDIKWFEPSQKSDIEKAVRAWRRK